MPSNFDMIENVYGRDAAESVRKMMDLAQEAVNKVHELYAQINAKDAEVARLRDALRPFADAWEVDMSHGSDRLPDWPIATIFAAYYHGLHLDYDNELDVLRGHHLRAAYLALHPDDTGGEDDA